MSQAFSYLEFSKNCHLQYEMVRSLQSLGTVQWRFYTTIHKNILSEKDLIKNQILTVLQWHWHVSCSVD